MKINGVNWDMGEEPEEPMRDLNEIMNDLEAVLPPHQREEDLQTTEAEEEIIAMLREGGIEENVIKAIFEYGYMNKEDTDTEFVAFMMRFVCDDAILERAAKSCPRWRENAVPRVIASLEDK